MMRAKPLSALLILGLFSGCGDDGGSGGEEASATDTDPTAGTTTMSTTTQTSQTSATSSADDGTTTGDPTATDTGDPTTADTTADTTTGNPSGDTAFRITSIEVRDPHFFAVILGDVTQDSVNDPLNAALSEDDSDGVMDGFLDLGFVMVMRPLEQVDGGGADFDFANAQCTAPVEGTSCDVLPGSDLFSTTYTNTADGECLAADPLNLSTYDDPPGAPTPTNGPCFVTDATDVAIQTSDFTLPMSEAVVAAQYVGDPAGNLVDGNIQGFLSLGDAQTTQVDTPLGQMFIADLLREEDMDDEGAGWWFHIHFTAETVDWTGR
jgi:hypothetical protein